MKIKIFVFVEADSNALSRKYYGSVIKWAVNKYMQVIKLPVLVFYASVNVNPVGGGLLTHGILAEKMLLCQSPHPFNKLSLSESPPTRSIVLPFVK